MFPCPVLVRVGVFSSFARTLRVRDANAALGQEWLQGCRWSLFSSRSPLTLTSGICAKGVGVGDLFPARTLPFDPCVAVCVYVCVWLC